MSISTPERIWWKPLGFEEKLWLVVALIWCVIMFLMMPLWHAWGKQNTPYITYRTAPENFRERANDFIEKYQVRTEHNKPVVHPPAGSDVYLVASTWTFDPILELERGKTYKLHVSSVDLQHGLSIQPLNMNFQVLPGYAYVLNLTPTTSGEFSLICNEYCGIGHHLMTGKIIVKE